MSDVDVNAVDARAHQLTMVRTVCRWTAFVLVCVVGACTYRCDPDAKTRQVEAEAQAERLLNQAEGRAEECRRWTQ